MIFFHFAALTQKAMNYLCLFGRKLHVLISEELTMRKIVEGNCEVTMKKDLHKYYLLKLKLDFFKMDFSCSCYYIS